MAWHDSCLLSRLPKLSLNPHSLPQWPSPAPNITLVSAPGASSGQVRPSLLSEALIGIVSQQARPGTLRGPLPVLLHLSISSLRVLSISFHERTWLLIPGFCSLFHVNQEIYEEWNCYDCFSPLLYRWATLVGGGGGWWWESERGRVGSHQFLWKPNKTLDILGFSHFQISGCCCVATEVSSHLLDRNEVQWRNVQSPGSKGKRVSKTYCRFKSPPLGHSFLFMPRAASDATTVERLFCEMTLMLWTGLWLLLLLLVPTPPLGWEIFGVF